MTMFSLLPAPLKVMLLGLLALLGLIIAAIISFMIIFLFSAQDIFSTHEGQEIMQNVFLLKIMQVINHVFMFIIPALLFAYLMQRNVFTFLGMETRIKYGNLLICFLLIIASVPIVSFLLKLNESLLLPDFLKGVEEWMQSTEERKMALTERLLMVETTAAWLSNLFVIAVIPAFSEEMFFRGALQRILHQAMKRPLWPILLSGIVFSAFHLQFYGFLPRMYLGVLFAFVFWFTQNLWYPIALHFFNNAITVTLYFIIHKRNNNPEFLQGPLPYPLLSLLISTAAVIILLLVFQGKHKKRVFCESENPLN